MTNTNHAEQDRFACETQNNTLGLLRLPAEIRSQIHDLSLLQNKILPTYGSDVHELCDPCRKYDGYLHLHRVHPSDLSDWNLQYNHCLTSLSNYATLVNMSQACRSLRAEVLKTFYANNTFDLRVYLSPQDDHLDQSISHTCWLRSRPPYILSCMKSIMLYFELPGTCQTLIRASERTRPTPVVDYGVKVHVDVEGGKLAVYEVACRRRSKAFGFWHCGMCWDRLKENVYTVREDREFVMLCETWAGGEWDAEDWIRLVAFVVEGARQGIEKVGKEVEGGEVSYHCSTGTRG